ncbi:lysophospholipid acyltransferase family protein [Thiobacter aerophilum]|uniref:Lysophospholipid acyltransferase family protein n=1 Tax=Thiobacter aerophilum TaxID=3121275 RepID=A0ABV0EED6_9BURK
MIVLRCALFELARLIATVIFSLIALGTFPFSALTRYRIITVWNRVVVWLARLLLGIDYRILGRENLPSRPAIVMAKHQSAWETIALPILLPPLAMVIKRELLKLPFFGWGFAMLSPIAIDRRAGKEALRRITEQGRQRLEQGFWVLIFPEGTRVAPGHRGRYGIGGAWLAAHTGAPVVPIAHNAGELWPRHAFLRYPGTITVSIGPVIETTGLKAGEINARVEAWIEGEMARLPPARRG